MPGIILSIPRDILDKDQVSEIEKDPCPGGAYILVRGGEESEHKK